MGKEITVKQAQMLLSKRKTGVIKGFVNNQGETLNGAVILQDDFSIGFDWKNGGNKTVIIVSSVVVAVLIVLFVMSSFFSLENEYPTVSDDVEHSETTAPSEATTATETALVTTTTTRQTTSETIPTTEPETISETDEPTGTPPITTILATPTTPQTTRTTAPTATTNRATQTTPRPTASTTARTPPSTTTARTTPTTPAPPSTPANTRATVNASGGVVLTWNAVSNADGYEVSRSTTRVGGYSVINTIATRDGNTIRATDSAVNAGTTYFYSVRAFRNIGGVRVWSEHSEIISVTTG
jgi:hypothetical protein